MEPKVTEAQLGEIVSRSVGAALKPLTDVLEKLAQPATPGATAERVAHAGGSQVEVRDPDLAIPESQRKCLNFARWMKCKALARRAAHDGEPVSAHAIAARLYGEQHPVTTSLGQGDAVARALGTDTLGGGGALVPTEFYTEVIEFLRPRQVVRSMNPTVLPMDNGKLSIPKITGGAASSYVGENANATATAQTFGDVNLNAKKLATIIPLSNDLIRRSNPAADMVVRDDLIASIGQASDQAWIRGTGSQFSPKGLRNLALAANVFASTGTTQAQVSADLTKMQTLLEQANVRMLRPGWLLSPRGKLFLMNLINTNGFYVYRAEMTEQKTLNGFPFASTSVIPVNLGGGTQTEVYLVDFADFVIGESTQMLLDSSTEAAYVDSNSNVIAAFSQDQTVIRAIMEHDCALRHDESCSVLTGVAW